MKLTSVKENLFALVIALFLAFWVVFFVNKTDFLKADIMTNKDQKVVNSDLSYEIKDSKIVVSSNKSFDWVLSLSMYMIYDQEKVKISKESIDSNFEFGLSSAWEWRINVILTNLWSVKAWENLMNVAFSWDNSSINLSDVTVKFTDEHWENLNISIKK